MQKPFRYTAALLLAVMLLSLSACGEAPVSPAPVAAPVPTPAPAAAPTKSSPEDLTGVGAVRISELMGKNHCTLRSEDGKFYDWVEIENVSAEPVALEGWQLSDKENKSGWSFPAVTLPAGEFLVVSCAKDGDGELCADFGISEGETVYLRNASGTPVSQGVNLTGEADVSVCFDGETAAGSRFPTPGFPNTKAGFDAWQESLARPEGLVINEVMVENFRFFPDGEEYPDWVELKNCGGEEISLSDYCLSDDEDDLGQLRLPDKTLRPGECVLVFCTGETVSGQSGITAPFRLDSTREQLFLSRGDRLIDRASLHDIPYQGSYGRRDGENGFFYFAEPTPGADNGEGCRRVSDTPVSLTPDGIVDGDSVTVELQGEGTIYYTTDSLVPTAEDTPYTEPITLDKTTVLRAVAVEEGALPSRALTLTYLINENLTLPAVSVVTDDLNRYNYIYHQNDKTIEVPGAVAFYAPGREFALGCGIKMNGSTSLELTKKNLALRFRGCYGQESLHYDLYGGGVAEFTNLVLRAGQDYYSAIFRTELMQELCLQASEALVTQRSRFTVMYVNGKYSGIYCLKEKTNEQLYASLLGIDKEQVLMEEAHLPPDSEFYREVWCFCRENDMSRAENYARFCELVDVDSLVDWIIFEGYCGNDDLTAGNVRYVRADTGDRKWRLVFYDLDSCLANPGKNFYNLLGDAPMGIYQISQLIQPLLQNEDFVDRLLRRAGELLNSTLSNENVISVIDRLAAEIENEVARDYVREDMTLDKWKYNVDFLRDFIGKNDWRQHNIDTLCEIFALTDAQRASYFGA